MTYKFTISICEFSTIFTNLCFAATALCQVFSLPGGPKNVIPLVQCITLYERYHIFWPTLYVVVYHKSCRDVKWPGRQKNAAAAGCGRIRYVYRVAQKSNLLILAVNEINASQTRVSFAKFIPKLVEKMFDMCSIAPQRFSILKFFITILSSLLILPIVTFWNIILN